MTQVLTCQPRNHRYTEDIPTTLYTFLLGIQEFDISQRYEGKMAHYPISTDASLTSKPAFFWPSLSDQCAVGKLSCLSFTSADRKPSWPVRDWCHRVLDHWDVKTQDTMDSPQRLAQNSADSTVSEVNSIRGTDHRSNLNNPSSLFLSNFIRFYIEIPQYWRYKLDLYTNTNHARIPKLSQPFMVWYFDCISQKISFNFEHNNCVFIIPTILFFLPLTKNK